MNRAIRMLHALHGFIKMKKEASPAGFEPARSKSTGLAGQLVNHSDKATYLKVEFVVIIYLFIDDLGEDLVLHLNSRCHVFYLEVILSRVLSVLKGTLKLFVCISMQES
ncbi:hypothetical protein EDC96DRAFT_540944 [Choanephora cucurbitarum]|nr:hypothetical protein EDC96DRAFT_540944 [Choanephora cucurbitarum]